MNQSAKILGVALGFAKPFTVSDLIVAAWRAFPKDFGMERYPYPNAMSVMCRLHGRTGLIERGMLVWEGEGTLRVSETVAGAMRHAMGGCDDESVSRSK